MSAEFSPIPHEEREQVTETPVLPAWYQAYKHGNRHHPQAIYGIAIGIGNEVTKSLMRGEVDLSEAVRSEFTSDQFADLTRAVVQAHQAFGIERMPSNAPEAGDYTFPADYWFNGTWSDMKRCLVRSVAYVGADKHPFDMQQEIDNIPVEFLNTSEEIHRTRVIRDGYRNSSPANNVSYMLMRDRDDIEGNFIRAAIGEFEESEAYQKTLPLVARMYEISADVLATDEARELARKRRECYREPDADHNEEEDPFIYKPGPLEYELKILQLIKTALDSLVEQDAITDDQVISFLHAVSANKRSKFR